VQTFDPLLGRQLGDFTIVERIGRGGMATVYRARQASMQRNVALKVIDLNVSDTRYAEFHRRFAREAELIAALEHLHILPVYAYGIEGDLAYLAMRLLPGGSIRDLLVEHQPLPIPQAIQLFRQVADGLAYAHSNNVIHRDLKPANVMLDTAGNAYLTDFGLAKMTTGEDITQQGLVVGTLLYIAPEQLKGERLDARADIYSMGVMLFEMLAGRTPFKGQGADEIASLVYQHLEAPVPQVITYNPDVPQALNDALMRSMAKKAADRYDDMNQFAQAVNSAVGGTTTREIPVVEDSERTFIAPIPQATTPLEPLPAVTPSPSSSLTLTIPHAKDVRVWILAGAILLVVAVLVVIGAMVANNNATPQPYSIALDERANWDTLVPSQSQIDTAKRVLEESFVGVIACNTDSEYHSTLIRETGARLRGYGLAFKVYDSQSDAYLQRVQLEKALTEGAGAIILCPITYDVIDQTLMAIDEMHLPLTAYSKPSDDASYKIVYTASDNTNYEMGQVVGQAAGEMIANQKEGVARVVILDFPDMDVIVERANGIEEALLQAAPNAEIVGRYLGGTRDNGYASIKQLLDEGIEFEVIASINDAGSIGAIKALEEANIPPDAVSIYSVDAEELAVDYIERGEYLRASLEVGRTQTADATVDVIVRMLAGDTVPQIIFIPLLDMLTAPEAE
jgi:serine/threonine protein kinase